jgi:zinc protease
VNKSFETPDKANAMVFGAIPLNADDDDPDFAALQIANNIFGSSPNSRLFSRIRGKDGLSYSVSSSYSPGVEEKYSLFVFQAIANPQNAPKAEAAFKEELNRAVTQGFTAEEVEAAKKQFGQDTAVQLSQDAYVASLLTRFSHYNRTMTRLGDLLNKVQGLTEKQVNSAFKKWIDPAGFSYFLAGDFKKAGVTQ